MESVAFWFIVLFAGITIYRMLSRRMATPKARVAGMLRRYRTFARRGLPEAECLFRLMAARSGWNKLPHRFLRELIDRLSSKEDVMRFISLSEDCGHVKQRFPDIAGKADSNQALTEVACLLSRFGYQLQNEGRLKEAEFVQKLALRLGPDCYFTNLPLAATYYETGRYGDARPLFERGLAQLEKLAAGADAEAQPFSPAACLGPDADVGKLRGSYRGKYEVCLKAAGSKGNH
jgi:tetratricopeptide (TPR) repeat protein